MNAQRALPAALAIIHASPPMFPAFITLTAVTVPGVSVVPAPLTYTLLAVVALLGAYGIVMELTPPRTVPPLFWALVAWLASGLLAAALGFNPLAGALFLGIFGLGIIWHAGIDRFYTYPGVARAIYWSTLVSSTLASLTAIAMVATKTPPVQYAMENGRATGTFILPGELAGYLIVILPIAYAVARESRDGRLRAMAWTALACGGAAMILTFSRAGWMGLAAACAFFVAARGGVPRRYAPVILLAGLAAIVAVFNVHHNPAENFTRLSIWQAATEIVRRFPLTGVGPFDFARIYALVRLPDGDAQAFHAHSFLLTIAAETGFAGVAAVVYTWWRFAQLFVRRVRESPQHAAIAFAVAAGLAGTLVQGLIDTVTVVLFGLWLPGMALALAAARHGLAEPAP